MAARKMAAPIIITVIVVALIIIQIAGIFFVPDMPLWIIAVGLLICLGAAGMMIYVLIERIKDIKRGEEDDLDNY